MPYFFITIIIILLDQASKLLIQTRMTPFQSIDFFNGFMSIMYARNSGAAFSILQSQTVLLIIITVAALLVLWFNRRQIANYPRIFQLGVAVALGGALGNFCDRVRLGGVVDFIDFHYWPVFNVADIAIVSGVGLAVLGLLINQNHSKQVKEPAPTEDSHLTAPVAGRIRED